jgi:hypothetical protein
MLNNLQLALLNNIKSKNLIISLLFIARLLTQAGNLEFRVRVSGFDPQIPQCTLCLKTSQ